MRGFVFVGVMILGLSSAISAAFADEITGNWDVSETVSPLTNLVTFIASTESTADLFTRGGRPKKASFVIRCKDNILSTFVTWPEILPRNRYDRTTVDYKVDNQLIKTDYWKIAENKRAAGGFDNDETMRILNTINSENQLVVRMTGYKQQDAVFKIQGIGAVIAKAQATCGLDANDTASAMPLVGFAGPGATAEVARPVAAILTAAKDALEAAGYPVVKRDDTGGTVATVLVDVNLSTKMADCGKIFGIPYLSDKRMKTAVAYFVSYSGGALTVKVSINGLYKAGYGNSNKPMTCVSKGELEKVMMQNIMTRL